MKDQVAVIGVGCTKFGDLFETSYEELICQAAFEAYDDAGTGIGYEPNLAMLPGLEPERRACRNVEAQAGIEIAVDAARFLDQIDSTRNSALARSKEPRRFFGD